MRQRRSVVAALVTEKGLGPSPAAATSALASDRLATVGVTLLTDKQTAEVQRQRQVRADSALEVAAFGAVLLAEEGRPDLAAKVADEQVAEMHRPRDLTTKHNL